MAIVTLAIVAVAGAFGNAQLSAQVNGDQSRLEVEMQQVTDYLRQPYNVNAPGGPQGVQYMYCASDTSSTSPSNSSYSVPDTIDGMPVLSPTGPVTSWSIKVGHATSADHFGPDGSRITTPPLQTCSASVSDWGVQQLTISLTSIQGRPLVRVMYKAAT